MNFSKARNKSKRNKCANMKQLSQDLLDSYEQDRINYLEEKLQRLKEAAKQIT